MEKRDIAYRKWKRYKTDYYYEIFKNLRTSVKKNTKSLKKTFYETRFRNVAGSKQKWKVIKEIGVGKNETINCQNLNVDALNKKFLDISVPIVTNNPYESVRSTVFHEDKFEFKNVTQEDVLSSIVSIKSNSPGSDNVNPIFLNILLPEIIFHITFICNSVLTKSIFPDQWKKTKIIPTPKTSVEYRPIAILPVLSKVLEKLMVKQINNFLYNNSLLTEKQSGYRPNRSCVTALINVIEDVRTELEKNKVSFLILLDHSKAFDTVNHNILCSKLSRLFNFSTTAVKLIDSYLSKRSQAVHVGNISSKYLSVDRGVPQGSNLGPLLFSLYINDLPDILQHCRIHMYADDVQLYHSSSFESVEVCVSEINEDLNTIYNWATKNGLCLNPDKSKYLVINRRKIDTSHFPKCKINNSFIKKVDTTKNLGIIFNSTLTWSDHINQAVGRVYSMLRSLWISQYYTPVNIRILLAKTYLLPTLLFGSEIFASADYISQQKMNILFNNINRYIYGIGKFEHVSHVSKKLLNISFYKYLKLKTLMFLFKLIQTKEPKYLYEKIIFSRSCRHNQIISFKHKILVSERQFFINASRLWNSLPYNFHFETRATHFKKQLLEHFFKFKFIIFSQI